MRRSDRNALFFLFALSGFAGLIYESIWTHYLKLFLGHAAYAQALVLAIFMGGMAIGSWIASARSGRWRNLLRAYALTEGIIGVFALVFHEVFRGATALAFDAVLPRLAGTPWAIVAFKWTLASALILPQCVLLGMTFPLMTAGVLRAYREQPGRSLAMLYFTNSIGAAIGVLVSGFVLVRFVGLPGTVRIAGLLNIAVAAIVWRRFGRAAGDGAAPAEAGAGALRLDRTLAAYLLVSFVTGASSFVYEIAWIRMLSLVLGSSTHAFEVMLSAFILGLALGGLFIQRRIDGMASAPRTLAIVQVAMGLLALATLPLYGSTFGAMRWLLAVLPRTDGGYTLFNLASNGIALAVMLPATFCAGMTLPLITFQLLRLGRGEGAIGAVYASNTVGAIVAVFLATHLGMPLLGLKGLLTAGAALDLALGVAIAWAAAGAFRTRRWPAALSAASVGAVALTLVAVQLDTRLMASGVYRLGKLLDPAINRVVLHRDGKTASVDLVATDPGYISIITNGKSDASAAMRPGLTPTLDEPTMILAAVVPMALHPEARTAAAIGFGSGMTTHTLLSNPRLASVDTIEIEEEMPKAARAFRPLNELAYVDPRSHIHLDDAKTFFSTHDRRYDLIVSEPSNPWVSGVAGLFSEEFYQLARRHLNEGGLFVQWIQLYEIDVELLSSVLKALGDNFSDYAVYAANDNDAIVVARNGPLGDPSPEILRLPGLASSLQRTRVAGVQDIEVRKIGTRKAWEGLVRSYAIAPNSDYAPVLDQNAARTRFLQASAAPLLVFARYPLPTLEILAESRRPYVLTTVTPALYFDGSRRAWQAELLRDLALAPDHPERVRSLAPQAARAAAPLVAWRRDCRGPFPLESFLSVAERVVPNLTTAELATLWAPLVEPACAAHLEPLDRAWVEFVRAVSARDARGIAVTSRDLLDGAQGLAPETVSYLVAAGMLGSIVQGETSAAERLWLQYGPSIAGDDKLLLRGLAAQCRRAAVRASASARAN
jgi:spermidine synthase